MTGGAPPPGLVAVPCERRMWTRSTLALLRLNDTLPAGSGLSLIPSTLIAPGRNNGVQQLRENPAWAWILHLDSDMTPPADVVQRLWRTAERAGADLVQASMVQKEPPYNPVGAEVESRGEPEDPLRPCSSDPDLQLLRPTPESLAEHRQPIDLDAAGTGCLLVRREVHEALDDPQFTANEAGGASDYNFTLRATDAGFRCVLDPTVRVGHVACYPYDVDDAVRVRDEQERDRRRAAGLRTEAATLG